MPRSLQLDGSDRRAAGRRPEIDAEFVASFRRRRIMDAAAATVAEQGFSATTIADVVSRAGVARRSLYEQFGGKEELFLATFDDAAEEGLRRVEAAAAGAAEQEWPERVRAALAALLDFVAEEPALARLCVVEAPSAGPEMAGRYEDALQRFASLLAAAAPHREGLPETIDETVVGGVAWILRRLIRRGEVAEARGLLPELTAFVLAPYA